jgi:hypothetical protein
MKRFVVAAVLAVALGFGFAGTAGAQIVYGYTLPAPGGGYMSNGQIYAPGAYKTYSTYYSPLTGGLVGQSYYNNIWGQAMINNYGYNPWTGTSYRYGTYQPNYYANPYLGYNYGFARRWW